jgi:sulfur carrier protein
MQNWQLKEQSMAGTDERSVSIEVNGRNRRTGSRTLAELVTEDGLAELRVATALNGAFVPASARRTTQINDGDRIEIVSPRQGG